MKKDLYDNYAQLKEAEREGETYAIETKTAPSNVLILSIHGGGIETGTTELAAGIAKAVEDERIIGEEKHNYYDFSGNKISHNRGLHMTSTRFDEPRALQMVSAAYRVVSIHGYHDSAPDEQAVYIGGRDLKLKQHIRDQLKAAHFNVKDAVMDAPWIAGMEPENITNKGITKAGVQLELTASLRHSFFQGKGLIGRKHKTDKYYRFVNAIRSALKKFPIDNQTRK